MSVDYRLAHLENWLSVQLPVVFAAHAWGQPGAATLTAASSDASFRRYFRWDNGQRTLIVMDAPPPQENCAPFVDIATRLAACGVSVPDILAADLEQGFLLLSDLGKNTYLEVINAENADNLFEDALQALVRFQQTANTDNLPIYDDALLRRELALFPDWYVTQHLKHSWDAHAQSLWERTCEQLIQSALAQPRVLVHRDYMPRNLMASEPNPGILDFQDAVLGPVTYDVTSLFKDAFLSWPEERIAAWLARYWELASAAGIPLPSTFDDFQRASDLMGVQRHLKVIGIFARICHRDGKPKYLGDVPRFFRYLHTVIARRPELAALGELLACLPQEPHA
ncbi:MAG: aminoglycoside phosphotransferase family protein [Pseudomonas sp.]